MRLLIFALLFGCAPSQMNQERMVNRMLQEHYAEHMLEVHDISPTRKTASGARVMSSRQSAIFWWDIIVRHSRNCSLILSETD